ncbi:5'-3' exonuclease PLD3-like isoform X2 [Chrysoperla carnea]|nr:5'-3' exonuclease PLD3-like isoform X2 [Chrysoperla carnea]
MLRDELDDERVTRWNRQGWCKPSCIPITVILILIFLVVLLPLLDHAMEEDNKLLNKHMRKLYENCPQSCRMSLIESIPQGLTYPNGSISLPSTYDTWSNLIDMAEETIEIGSFYWTLRRSEMWPDDSSEQGENIFQGLLDAGTNRGIKIKIAQNWPTSSQPNTDTEYLTRRGAAEVRSLNFAQINANGGGVLHTKLWVVDRKHFYVGSANLDWRALTQVKEMGAVFYNCSCLAEDIAKIFDVYWMLGENPHIPDKWPDQFSTKYNYDHPMNISFNNMSNYNFLTSIGSSPPTFCPEGRDSDIDTLLRVIQLAEKFIYISVMDYSPLTVFTPRKQYWPVIDNALRTAAIDHRIKVKMLISVWNHSHPSETNFLKSLQDITGSYPGVNLEVKRFKVPGTPEQNKIPFARVNHNKYMVTDNTAYIGTSNWSGDYFTDTAGIGLMMHDPVLNRNTSELTVRGQLQAVFERDWNSEYAYPIE